MLDEIIHYVQKEKCFKLYGFLPEILCFDITFSLFFWSMSFLPIFYFSLNLLFLCCFFVFAFVQFSMGCWGKTLCHGNFRFEKEMLDQQVLFYLLSGQITNTYKHSELGNLFSSFYRPCVTSVSHRRHYGR